MKNKITRGERFSVTLNYVFAALARAADHASKRPELIGSNMAGGADPRALAVEFDAVHRLRPNVKKPVWHCSLALPNGERLDSKKWAEVVERFLEKMGFDVALTPYICVRHSDKPKSDHVHVVLNRISLSGELWHGQWEARRAIQACQELEREFGLTLTPGLHGDDDAAAKAARPDRQADSQAVINANRVKGQPRIDTTETARILLNCASRSHDLPTFTAAAALVGVKVLPNRSATTGRMSGLSVIPKGRKKPVALSAATKNKLSWSKLLKIFEQNDAVADAARRAAADAVAVATSRATQQASARLARQPAPFSQQPRALSPGAIDEAKEAIMTDDKLEFLNAPPEPRPVGQRLDDVPLADGEPLPLVVGDEEDEARVRERASAVADRDAELKQMKAKQLIELRNATRRPLNEAIIAAALLEKLLQLALRILSFGTWKKSTPMADLIAQREQIAAAAEEEIARRTRSPVSVRDRMAALKEHENALVSALQSSELEIDARHDALALAELYDTGQLRAQVTAGFDQGRADKGLPTTAQLRTKLRGHDKDIAGLKERAPGQLARRMKTVAAMEWKKKMDRSAELRARTAAQLAALLDAIELATAKHEAAKVAANAEANQVLDDEAEALTIEIRDRVPEVRSEIESDADVDVDAAHRMKGDRPADRAAQIEAEDAERAERERAAAREEWLALMRKSG